MMQGIGVVASAPMMVATVPARRLADVTVHTSEEGSAVWVRVGPPGPLVVACRRIGGARPQEALFVARREERNGARWLVPLAPELLEVAEGDGAVTVVGAVVRIDL